MILNQFKMDDFIKVPFLETKLSKVDLINLEKNGTLRSVFIELLKNEKIQNVIPDKLQLKQISEELYLKNDIKKINEDKNKTYYMQILNKQTFRIANLRKFAIERFENNAEAIFNSRKENYYDQYIYSLLRNKNKNLIFEFYYQIESKEESINQLSNKYSSGSEKLKFGVIGPITLENVHAQIAEILKRCKEFQINEPFIINEEWYILQKEKFIPAEYNDFYKWQICMQLLEKELENEYLNFINATFN